MVVRTTLNLMAVIAAISAPIIPFSAAKIAAALGLNGPLPWPPSDGKAALDQLAPGAPITVPEVLFAKIEDEQVAEWTARFGGTDAA